MTSKSIAVAMSVYSGDRVEFLSEAINSILEQSYQNFKLFIHVDGAVSDELSRLLKNSLSDSRVEVKFHDQNLGLATRLNQIIDHVVSLDKFSYLARMDADDISDPERFKKQIEFFEKNASVSVLGTDVIELSESGELSKYKSMESDHEIMVANIVKKCPFNHPTVMFDISVFINGCRYNSKLNNTQDYYLWVDLITCGIKFSNINEALLKFRVDNDFYSRRGFKKALNDFNSRVYAIKKLRCLTITNCIHVLFLVALRVSPAFIKKMAYKYLR